MRKIIAITGTAGVGKSTLMALLQTSYPTALIISGENSGLTTTEKQRVRVLSRQAIPDRLAIQALYTNAWERIAATIAASTNDLVIVSRGLDEILAAGEYLSTKGEFPDFETWEIATRKRFADSTVDMTILLTADPNIIAQRVAERDQDNKTTKRDPDDRVNELAAYTSSWHQKKPRTKVVDTTHLAPQAVHTRIKALIDELLIS